MSRSYRRSTPIAPRGAREARLWNWLRKETRELFYEIDTWPESMQRIALQEHKENKQRFALLHFLIENGCAPGVAMGWMMAKDVQNGKIIAYGYNNGALRDIESTVKRAVNGELGKYRVYDMWIGKAVTHDVVKK